MADSFIFKVLKNTVKLGTPYMSTTMVKKFYINDISAFLKTAKKYDSEDYNGMLFAEILTIIQHFF